MARINIRDLYPSYKCNCFIDVPDEVSELIKTIKRERETRARYKRRNKIEFLSLDCDGTDVIQMNIMDKPLLPCEVAVHKEQTAALHAAIAKLPDKQAKRIYAYYFLDMSYAEISTAEGVDERSVRENIQRGLNNLVKNLKNFF